MRLKKQFRATRFAPLVLLLLVTTPLFAYRKVTITWNASIQPPTVRGYQVFRKVNSNAFALRSKVGTNLTFVDKTAPNGANVCYYVIAIGSNGKKSVASNTVCRQLP